MNAYCAFFSSETCHLLTVVWNGSSILVLITWHRCDAITRERHRGISWSLMSRSRPLCGATPANFVRRELGRPANLRNRRALCAKRDSSACEILSRTRDTLSEITEWMSIGCRTSARGRFTNATACSLPKSTSDCARGFAKRIIRGGEGALTTSFTRQWRCNATNLWQTDPNNDTLGDFLYCQFDILSSVR